MCFMIIVINVEIKRGYGAPFIFNTQKPQSVFIKLIYYKRRMLRRGHTRYFRIVPVLLYYQWRC